MVVFYSNCLFTCYLLFKMGNKKSIPYTTLIPEDRWSCVMKDMVAKYGLRALDCLEDWNKMGFPEQGSLSVKKLLELQVLLKLAEKKMKENKTIKRSKLDKCDKHKAIFALWLEEAEYRQRKSELKEMPKIDPIVKGPPAYVEQQYSQNSALYPPLQAFSQIDLDLDRPPLPVSRLPPTSPQVLSTPSHLTENNHMMTPQAVAVNRPPPTSPQVLSTPSHLTAMTPRMTPQDVQPTPCLLTPQILTPQNVQPNPPFLLTSENIQQPFLTSNQALSYTDISNTDISQNIPQKTALTPTHQALPYTDIPNTDVSNPLHQSTPLLPNNRRHGPLTRAQGAERHYHLDCRPTTKELYPENMIQPDQANDHTTPQLQCPMVEVSNAYGQIMMVQRLWSPSDIIQYAATLEKPSQIGGQRWTDQLRAFCRTYRPTMKEILDICAKNMDASKMQQILEATEAYHDERPIFVRYEDNRRYMTAIEAICEKTMTLFPTVLNLDEVYNCKQQKDETISQFRHRLEQAIFTHGGGGDPNNPFAKAFLVTQLMNNMKKDLAKGVKQSLIGYKTADPSEIIKHATHAEELQKDTKEKEKKQEKEKTDALQLAMIDAVTKLATDKEDNKNRHDNRRYGKPQFHGRPQYNNGNCFNCNSTSHWRSDCPEPPKKPNGRGRGNGGRGRGFGRGHYDRSNEGGNRGQREGDDRRPCQREEDDRRSY